MGLFCYTFPDAYIFWIVYTIICDNIWLNRMSSRWSVWLNCVGVYCTGNLYLFKPELKFLHKKQQIPNEQLYRAHLECASQWEGMWLCVETARNMKLYNINDILYDKWSKS